MTKLGHTELKVNIEVTSFYISVGKLRYLMAIIFHVHSIMENLLKLYTALDQYYAF